MPPTTMIERRALIGGAAAFITPSAYAAAEPMTIGISGPLTGQYAQYGADWRRGFDLAPAEVNGAGGIGGRPPTCRFEDNQSDPRQAVAIAQVLRSLELVAEVVAPALGWTGRISMERQVA